MNFHHSRLSASLSLLLILSLVSLHGCGDQQESEQSSQQTPANLLIKSFPNAQMTRSSEVRTFVGEDLYEHINGGAEAYHPYGFIDVSNAYYKLGKTEISVDIYRFASADMAFGLFSTLRPPEPEPIRLGAGGFKSPSAGTFIKGPFMVRLTGYDETSLTASGLQRLAASIAATITGRETLPSILSLFPSENQVPNSQRMSATDFMGRAGVNQVFTADYRFEVADSILKITLFLAEDISGAKFAAWNKQVTSDPSLDELRTALKFDDGYSIGTTSSFSGTILAGLKSGKLAGVSGYDRSVYLFLSGWISRLGQIGSAPQTN